jgi:hypothetical protein
MVKRKTSSARVSIDALENISKLSKDSGLTSAEIIDDALKAYGKETHTPNKNDSYNKLKKLLRAEFIKSIQDNPSYLKLDNTKPPNAVLDACILSLWGNPTIESLNAIMNPDYEDFARPRHDIIQTVKYHVEKPVDGTSWAELHKSWYNTHTKYKGRFETGIDNRIKSLIRANILKPFKGEEFSDKEIDRLERKFINKITSAPDLNLSSNSGEEIMAQLKVKNKNRGRYILYRDLTDDENIIIEGILRLQPQKGIVIPKII